MKGRYIKGFDGLRGMAVLLVVGFHGIFSVFRGGFIGVDLFFVISGYLITSLLWSEYHKTESINFGQFYLRRALRLFPALIACVVLANLLWDYSVMPDGSDQTLATVAALSYFSNLIADYKMGNLNHLWSLSVEEHFYMMWPLIVYFVIFRLTSRRRLLVMNCFIIAVIIFRIIAFRYGADWKAGIFLVDPYGFTLCRIDCIMIGALLFFMVEEGLLNTVPADTTNRVDKIVLIIIGVFFAAFSVSITWSNPLWLGGGFMITNVVCAATVYLALRNPDHSVLTAPIFVWIGKRSYGLYLYHVPVFFATESLRVPHDYKNFAWLTGLRLVITFALTAASYAFLETPMLKLKRRYETITPSGNV